MTKESKRVETEPTALELDYAFIDAFGEPLRDAEQLSWDNLKWNPDTKTITTLGNERT